MKNILVLIKNNLKIAILVKPFNFIVSLLAPFLILILVLKLNFGGGSYINVAVVDEDKSISSESIINEIKSYEAFNVINLNNKEEIIEKLTLKEINLAIKIDKDFEKDILENKNNMNITSYGVEDDDSLEMIKSIVKTEKKNLKEISLSVKADKVSYYKYLNEYITKKEESINKMSLNDLYTDYMNSRIFIGFIIAFILTKGLKHSYRIFIEKEQFIYNRIFMAPIKTYEYYVADILSGFIDIFIQIILSVIGIELLKVNIGISNLALILILSLVGIVGISLCIFLRTFTKNRNELSNIYNFIYIILLMLGGAFIPLEVLPTVVNKISYFNPIRWASESITKMQQGGDLKDISLNFLVLILFSLVFLVIGIYRTKNEDKTNIIA